MYIASQKDFGYKTSSDLLYEDTGGCINSLSHIPAGEVWTVEDIIDEKQNLLFQGRSWTIVDNLPVHEAIKTGAECSGAYLENYEQSLINLAQSGIKVVCYNFMPVLYKIRTHFCNSFEDRYAFSLFDPVAFAVFDIYILKRPGAESSYTNYQKHTAKMFHTRLTAADKHQLAGNILSCVQSGEPVSLTELLNKIRAYSTITNDELASRLHAFNKRILPLAKHLRIQMHFVKDNPCGNLFDLPCATL